MIGMVFYYNGFMWELRNPPFQKLESNGRLLGEFDIFIWQGKCQIWIIQSFLFEKKVVVTESV
jgi:hypothetical protein